MPRIGVDFDNTIACYDLVFLKVAQSMGYLQEHSTLNKSQVKNTISKLDGGDLLWQKIQGQVYGKYMHQATVYAGFIEFLCIAKLRGDEVYIVSHKSEYGHFDESKTNLRQVSKLWINKNVSRAACEYQCIDINQIYFESTRGEKLNRIDQLECDIFIDDLQEVFDDVNFPSKTEKILFSDLTSMNVSKNVKHLNTWRKIIKYIYVGLRADEIKSITQVYFPSLIVEKVVLKKGRGNSQIYQLWGADEKKYALKIYPDAQLDNRPRLATEIYVSNTLANAGFPVPKAVESSFGLNWGVYEWIDGEVITGSQEDFIEQSFFFIKKLQCDELRHQFLDAPLASEACLSGEELIGQIKKRLNRLLIIPDSRLQRFLNLEFLPIFNSVAINVELTLCEDFFKLLPIQLQVLSPSDFGSHNALVDYKNKYHYYDFEYFGWDDPVKLVSDFFWHPGMDLTESAKIKWLALTEEFFAKDLSYKTRLKFYLPLFGLRWCLIILNEFMPERLLSRVHANSITDSTCDVALNTQLEKSKKMLQEIVMMVGYGSKIKRA